MSTLLLVIVIGAALTSAFVMVKVLDARGQADAVAERIQTARVVASAVVHPRLDAAALAVGRLTGLDVAEMQDAVGVMRDEGQLLGLGIWRADGTPLFVDGAAGGRFERLSDEDLRRAQEGQPWTARTSGRNGVEELRIFLPSPDDEPAIDSVTQIVLPPGPVAIAIEDRVLRQQLWVVAMFGLLICGLIWARRRLLRRERHARHDALTGVLNRRALHEDAQALLAKASFKRPLALLLVDLSEFKSVNDTLGHAAGDQLLQQVAAAIAGAVRPGDLVVRLGGDEFAILLTDLRTTSGAQDRAEQLLHCLRETTFTVYGVDLSVDASIGVALAPEHGTQVADLLQRADVAMYQAKRSHRGTAVYDPATDSNTVGQLEMITELHRALDNEEFVLHYQPKVSLEDLRVIGVEALVRWQHPSRGLIPPGEFLPVLEQVGLMQPLTRWVLREAIQQAANWQRAGMPLQVAVNISPRSLLDESLPARVLAILLAAELPASLLQLEITETAVMTNPERAAFVLTQLQARGIEVSIDDFGAGYTSLALLCVLPVTELKIDRSLVTHMLTRSENHAVTQAVIDLAHRLGLRVVGEGVETEEVRDRLAALGCDSAQGYLISAPMPPLALEGWLTEWHAQQEPPVRRVVAS